MTTKIGLPPKRSKASLWNGKAVEGLNAEPGKDDANP